MLSYYLEYLKSINNSINDDIIKLNDKYNKYTANLQYGSGFSMGFVGKLNNIRDTLSRIKVLLPELNEYNKTIVNIIDKIEKVYESGKHINDMQISSMHTLLNHLDTMNKKILDIVSIDTIYGEPVEKQMFMKDNGNWENILSIYKILINNYNNVKKEISDKPLSSIYITLSKHIQENIEALDDLDKIIEVYKIKIKSNIDNIFDIDEYRSSDIVYERNSVYKYTLRLNFKEKVTIPIGNDYAYYNRFADELIKNVGSINIDMDYENFYNIKETLDKKIQFGGNTEYENQKEIINVNNLLLSLSQKLEKINIKIENVTMLENTYNQYRARYTYYITYLILCITKYDIIGEQIIYKYINKGTIQFYHSIINNILSKINEKTKSDIIDYMSKYHYFTLIKLQKFCDFLIKNMQIDSVINVFESTKLIVEFTLLNNFKDIIESYHETFQHKVGIYSRINDWADASTLSETDKVFTSFSNDATKMNINLKPCDNKDINYVVKFNEVFDSIQFKSNSVISKYMSLETQISKSKGVMIITYGYSGVGKTMTLFGTENQEGILQSTLNNIRDVGNAHMRIYELYGFGTQYSDYWKKEDNIAQELIAYKLKLTGDTFDISNVTNGINGPNINKYINDNNYYLIDKSVMEHVFKNFSTFIDKLDRIRKANNRITSTPNNPESSRSIIVYDIQIEVKNKKVPFVIFDLPGREEIIQTYVNTYLDKPYIKKEKIDTIYNKVLLASLALNPLATALIIPSIIYETVNKLDFESRRQIFMTQMEDEKGNMVVFPDEYLSNMVKDNKVIAEYKLRDVIDFNNSRWDDTTTDISNKYTFYMINNKNYDPNVEGSPKRIIAINLNSNINNPKQIPKQINSMQYQCVCALHVLNRIIKKNRFDVLAKITENAVNEYINNKLNGFISNMDDNAKKRFLNEYLETGDYNLPSSELEKLVSNIVHYKYYSTPNEGIFINENIIGLIKYLSKDIMGKSDIDIKQSIAPEQNANLGFAKQKAIIRSWNYKLYKISDQDINMEKYENIMRDINILNEMYESISKSYISDAIYNYDKPFIGDVLEYYKQEKQDSMPINDYKIFYLFSNTKMKLKCQHQVKLLDNTQSFINAIEN